MDTDQIRTTIMTRRRERGLTQQQLADSASVTREAVSRFENDAHDIGLRRLLRLCAALDLELFARPGHGRPVMEELDQLFKDAD